MDPVKKQTSFLRDVLRNGMGGGGGGMQDHGESCRGEGSHTTLNDSKCSSRRDDDIVQTDKARKGIK